MNGPRLTFLGTGTSQGIPIIGCRCEVCRSASPEDKRFRAAAFVEWNGLNILVDAGPDFRMQMLGHGIGHLDAILLTHNHKDHTGGLDDVRSLNYIDRKAVDIFCEQKVLDYLKIDYGYAFAEHKYPGAPEWHVHLLDGSPFRVYDNHLTGDLEWVHDVGYFFRQSDGSLLPSDNAVVPAEPAAGALTGEKPDGSRWVEIIPIRGYHDQMPVLGFRFGEIAYITDMSRLPDEELPKLKGLRHLTLNTVGYKPHHSHFSLDEAIALSERIGAEHTWLTHLSHTFPVHAEFAKNLAARTGGKVLPAFDGLVIE